VKSKKKKKRFDPWSVFLSEGVNDIHYREMAERLVDGIVKKLTSHASRPDKVETKEHSEHIIYNLSKLLNQTYLKNVELSVGISDESTSVGSYHDRGTKKRITLTASDTKKKYFGTEEGMKTFYNQLLPDFIERNREYLVHEFIHMLDGVRITADKPWNRAAGAEGSKYYNDPLETNAFAQQGMSKFTQKLKHIHSLDAAKMLMGKTPQEFWTKLSKSFEPKFLQNLTPQNKKKLQKRSYQLWQDIHKKYEKPAGQRQPAS
jgi:hypothetical protein